MSERAPMQDTLGSDGTYQATLSGVEPAESESEPRYQDEQWLREQYVEKELSTYEIAEKCECSDRTVCRWLQKHGVERRAPHPEVDERLEDSEWLHEQYVEKELTTYEIAEKCRCGDSTVWRWLQKHGIETRAPGTQVGEKYQNAEWMREQYVEKELSTYEIAEKCGCSHVTVRRWLQNHGIERRDPNPTPDKRLEDLGWMREQYVEKELSTREIAEKCGCSSVTVRDWLQNHGIERRDPNPISDKRLEDSEWLHEQYVEKGLKTHKIAEKCECSADTVCRWLQNHGIETRDTHIAADKRLEDSEWLHEQYVEKELSTREIAEKCGCSDVTVSNWLQKHGIKARNPMAIPDKRLEDLGWMREQYVEKELSTHKIAEKCECSHSSVRNWLQNHGIGRRPPASELSGENHPRWNGGPTPYGPGWNESKRRQVRERDNHTCQGRKCDTTQSEHRERHGEKLHVHHLQKARDVDDPEERNAAENLVTLCRDCHQRWEQVADAGLVPQFPTVADD